MASRESAHPPFYYLGLPMALCRDRWYQALSQYSWSKKNDGKLEGLYPCTLIISL